MKMGENRSSETDKLKTDQSINGNAQTTSSSRNIGETVTAVMAKDETCPSHKELSTKEAYFASLNVWAQQAKITQNAAAMFPWYLLSSYPQLFQQQTVASPTPFNLFTANFGLAQSVLGQQQQQQAVQAPQPLQPQQQQQQQPNQRVPLGGGYFRVLDEQAQTELINRNGGFDCIVAPFWKRSIAEIIDWLILLLLKIMVTFTIMNIFDLDLGFDINKDLMQKAFPDDDELYTTFLEVSMDFITLSSDLLLIELLTKFVVCCYEAFWTTWHNGATPGKSIMKIRIQYVEAVLPLQGAPQPQFIFQPQREPVRVLMYPGETPCLKRSFIRAVSKNMVMTLLFPICVIMIFFKNNRTAYDIMTKTIVVESDPIPNFRRQR